MAIGLKNELFEIGRKSLNAACLSTSSEDSLLCPLCWQETSLADLSLEHIVPGAIGGTCKTLTCRRCNNDQGAKLDSHLAGFQKTKDAFKGHGLLSAKLHVNGNLAATNLECGEGRKNFIVVGKATNPIAAKAIHD